MDPNEAYRRISEAVDGILSEREVDITEMAEAFEALDHWLTMGGFLPQPWQEANRAHKALLEIHSVLYPDGDPDAEWSSDELPLVAAVLEQQGVR